MTTILQMLRTRRGRVIASEQRVRDTEVNLAIAITPQLAAKRTLHNDGCGRVRFSASRHISSAQLAADDIDIAPNTMALRAAVVHAHDLTVSAQKAKTQTAQFLVKQTPTGCGAKQVRYVAAPSFRMGGLS